MMKGSEKQIKWAKDLQATALRTLEESKAFAIQENVPQFVLEWLDKYITLIGAEKDAGKIIDILEGLEYRENDMKRNLGTLKAKIQLGVRKFDKA